MPIDQDLALLKAEYGGPEAARRPRRPSGPALGYARAEISAFLAG
jgi:hypothetical protein